MPSAPALDLDALVRRTGTQQRGLIAQLLSYLRERQDATAVAVEEHARDAEVAETSERERHATVVERLDRVEARIGRLNAQLETLRATTRPMFLLANGAAPNGFGASLNGLGGAVSEPGRMAAANGFMPTTSGAMPNNSNGISATAPKSATPATNGLGLTAAGVLAAAAGLGTTPNGLGTAPHGLGAAANGFGAAAAGAGATGITAAATASNAAWAQIGTAGTNGHVAAGAEGAARTTGTQLLRVEGLSKQIGDADILENINFSIYEGEILGLIGPNGAGKTTLMECLAGMRPRTGGVFYIGDDIPASWDPKELLFYLPNNVMPYGDLYTIEVLTFFGRLYEVDPLRWERIILHDLSLGPVLAKRVSALSKGNMQRLLIALALLSPQPLLALDEPFDGLDLHQTSAMMGILRGLREQSRTLLLCIHQLNDAERICDRLLLLSGGHLVGMGTLAELRAQTGLAEGSLEEIFLALTGRPQGAASA